MTDPKNPYQFLDSLSLQKTAPGEIVATMDDLLLEIFQRLPSEDQNPQFKQASPHLNSLASDYYPLTRLCLVSRYWNSLIHSMRPSLKPLPAAGLIFEPPRRSKHASTAESSSYILFLDRSIPTTAPFRKINEDDPSWHCHSKVVVHSCNGLLLLCPATGKHSTGSRKKRYSVCNPTTGKHSTLPQVPRADNQVLRGVFLAFDPCKSPYYKVVCLLGFLDQAAADGCQFVVYSSETGCWGEPLETNFVRSGKNNNEAVYWNGAIHWVGSSSELICFDPDDRSGQQQPKVFPMPKIARKNHPYYFGESCGHLHYVGLKDRAREFDVHEMSSDYSGWVVKYRVNVSNAVKDPSFYYGHSDFVVYAVVRGERAEDMFLVLGVRTKNKIVRFNHDNTFETIHDFTGSKYPDQLNHPFQYIESLASV